MEIRYTAYSCYQNEVIDFIYIKSVICWVYRSFFPVHPFFLLFYVRKRAKIVSLCFLKMENKDMRYQKIMRFILAGIIVCLLSSCLKDVNSVFNPGLTPAVTRQFGDSAVMMATTRFGVVYSTKLSSFSRGKCLLVNFDYDATAPENKDAEQKGYYTVTMLANDAVNQQDAISPLTPTNKVVTNEQPVTYAVEPAFADFYVDLENFLFLPSVCLSTDQQTVVWQLSYDPVQKPVVEDKKSIYSLYLRASATTGRVEGAEVKSAMVVNAFNISNFIKDMKDQGGREADMYVRIHYVNQINPKDSTQFTWGVTDPLRVN